MSEYKDIYYKSSDGLSLYARDYSHPDPTHTILCMHGLSRNSADFEDIAAHLNQHSRIRVVDQRGRGKSDYDPNWENYLPATYVNDMFTLIDHLELKDIILFGTSMGGLMSMIMAASRPELFQRIIINDIGPIVNAEGLNRLKGYVGKTKPVTSWPEASIRTQEINGAFYPNYNEDDWMQFARRTYHEQENGCPILSYDPNIAKPIEASEEAAVSPDLWQFFEACNALPTLVLRGEYSDLLTVEIFQEMQNRHPKCEGVTIHRVGHAPILNESESVDAVEAFLKQS